MCYLHGSVLSIVSQALLNLGSSDPSLRSAAYNLLCTLTQTFDLKIEGQLLETAGTVTASCLSYHNNNNNINDDNNVYGAVIMTKSVTRVHLVHLMNAD